MKDRQPLKPNRVLITPEGGSDPYYATVTRADDPVEPGTTLSKTTFLKDTTAALYGLGTDAVPDDVLAFLGKYSQYWWKRRTVQSVLSESAVFSKRLVPGNAYTTWYYSSSYTVNADDTITLNSPASVAIRNDASEGNPLNGKYFAPAEANNTAIFLGCSNPTGSIWANIEIQAKELSIKKEYGAFEFVVANDGGAYPHSGISDGYEYSYLGVPFENSVNAIKIATGSYVGTGTNGVNNPNRLTFGCEPKIVVVFLATNGMLFFRGNTQAIGIGASNELYCTTNWTGNTVVWYGSSANQQLNDNDVEYYYIAIC